MENPPGIEKKKECLVVEQQGKGFTLVDEKKDNYLWQDEHGQVLWTKDRNVLDAAKKEIEAKLTAVDDEKITLEWQAREPKKIGKGKETVDKKLELPYESIKEAIVIVSF